LKDAVQGRVSSESSTMGGSRVGEPQAPVGTSSSAGSELAGTSKGHGGGLRLSSTSFTERDDGSVLWALHDFDASYSPAVQVEDVEAAVCARVDDANESQLLRQPRQCSVPHVHAFIVCAAVLLILPSVSVLIIRLA
jgi:hypothetical protein